MHYKLTETYTQIKLFDDSCTWGSQLLCSLKVRALWMMLRLHQSRKQWSRWRTVGVGGVFSTVIILFKYTLLAIVLLITSFIWKKHKLQGSEESSCDILDFYTPGNTHFSESNYWIRSWLAPCLNPPSGVAVVSEKWRGRSQCSQKRKASCVGLTVRS